MLVITSGDADDQTRDFIFFFTEAHAFRVLAEDDAGFQHAVLRFDGAVRYRNGLAEIGRGQFFAVQHRLHIFRLDVAAFHQLLTGEANGFFFGGCFATEEDVIRAQLEQVVVSIVKAVFQAIGDFDFVVDVALGRDQALGQAGVQTAVEEVGQRNMLRLRHLAHGALGKVAVGDDRGQHPAAGY